MINNVFLLSSHSYNLYNIYLIIIKQYMQTNYRQNSAITNNITSVFELKSSVRIKICIPHCVQSWLALVTTNNVFSLWNYQHKIILKSFNCSTLDDSKQLEIRELLFFDRFTLKSIINSQKETKPKNWIVFCGERKIFLYDYLTDGLKVISEKELDFKIIGEDTIGVGTTQGSLKIVDLNHLTVLKTLKGYHTKAINWIIPYKQNQNEKARVIAASIDSLMACWNVDSSSETPSFKFLMKKNKTNDSNDGQEILHMKYDQNNFRILTLTEDYITVWSTLSGSEIKRYKNVKSLIEIEIFSHFNFCIDSFLCHNRNEEVLIASLNIDQKNSSTIPNFQTISLFNLKELGQSAKIVKLQTIREIPHTIFMITTTGVNVIEIYKFFAQNFCFKESFITKLSLSNCREFFSEQILLPNVTPYKINNIQFKSQELYNMFYLSTEKNWVYYNLIEIRIVKMTIMKAQFKLFEFDNQQLLKDKVQIDVSFENRDLSLFSKASGYFEIYSVIKPKDSLIDLEEDIRIDFYSKFKQILSGLCIQLVWHQYKTEFAVICPINSKANPIKKITSSKNIEDSKITGYCLFVYSKLDTEFILIYKKDIQSEIYELFGGPYYVYSIKTPSEDQNNPNQIQILKKLEKVEFLQTDQKKFKIIPPAIFCPKKIFWNYCGTQCVVIYPNEAIVYKMESKGLLTYVRAIQQSIITGYFWDKLFFFLTDKALYFMTIIKDQIVIIKLADKNIRLIKIQRYDIFEDDYIDNLEGAIEEMPTGQIQILGIVNGQLMVITQDSQIFFFKLQHPYVKFSIEIISGHFETSKIVYSKLETKLKPLFNDTIKEFGYEISQFL